MIEIRAEDVIYNFVSGRYSKNISEESEHACGSDGVERFP